MPSHSNSSVATGDVARIGFGEAVAIASREAERLGLALTHELAGFYAAPDAHAEGADFAATLVRRDRPRGRGGRLKMLIACDGQVTVCPFARRCARPCQTASRC
jgi:hypothetical protein